MKKLVFLLIFVILFTVSCSTSEETSEAVSKSESKEETSVEASAESSDETSTGEAVIDESKITDVASLISAYASFGEKASSPVIAEWKAVEDGRIVIAGTCDENSKVYLTDGEKILAAANSDHGTFIIEYKLRKANSPLPVELYSAIVGRQVSDKTTDTIRYTCHNGLDVASWVWVGKDGWLFFNNTEQMYTNNEHLSSRAANRINTNIGNRVKSLADKNKKLVYVLIPNPNELYSEAMPESIIKGNVCFRDEVAKALTDAGVTVINMGDILKEHMNDGYEMFHHTDSHWTEYSAYWTYVELCKLFESDGFDSSPRDISEFGFANEFRKAGDLYYDLGMDITKFEVESTFSHINFDTPVDIAKYEAENCTRINDTCTEYMEFHNPNGENKPSFVMMRDSYSIMLFDWLAERSNNSYYKPLWKFEYDENEYTNVDYVIYFVCDMNLTSVLR